MSRQLTIAQQRERFARKTPFRLDYKLPELQFTKVEYDRADGTIAKRELPVVQELEEPELFCYCLKEFNTVANDLGWNGLLKFQRYRRTLAGAVKDEWDNIRAQQEDPNDVQEITFLANVRAMLSTITGPKSYENFMNYLSIAKKPRSMTPKHAVSRVRTMCSYLPYLTKSDGTAPEALTESQIRSLASNIMPDEWIKLLETANLDPATMTTGDMTNYYAQLHSHEVDRMPATLYSYQGRGNFGRGRGRGQEIRNYYSRGGFGRSYAGRGNFRGRGRGQQGRRLPPMTQWNPDAGCPLHGGINSNHLWRECGLFRPREELIERLRTRATGRGGFGRFGQRTGRGRGQQQQQQRTNTSFFVQQGAQLAQEQEQAQTQSEQQNLNWQGQTDQVYYQEHDEDTIVEEDYVMEDNGMYDGQY